MATTDQTGERIARTETKIDRCESDIARVDSRIEELKKEIREYLDKRAKEIFELCSQEQQRVNTESKKSSLAITLSGWQLIVAILALIGLIVTIILQAKHII